MNHPYFVLTSGQTPAAFLRAARVFETCQLMIREPELPIVAVEEVSVFPNLRSMQRAFHATAGATPCEVAAYLRAPVRGRSD